mgnify:CR=1 FL=1
MAVTRRSCRENEDVTLLCLLSCVFAWLALFSYFIL